jgi:hypothetical protein
MKNVTQKHPEQMTSAELAEATREYDLPQAWTKSRPMTPAERAQERALRRGRPKIGQGAEKISISLERGVLRQTDALARKRGLKRSELIARFVAAGLKRAG